MSSFGDLIKIVRDGGLEVVTRLDATGPEGDTSIETDGEKKETQEERKTYKIYDTIGIRTTIQLDGDCVTIMSRQVLGMPEVWGRHTESLKEKLSLVKRVRRLALSSSLVLFVIFILPVIPVIYEGATASGLERLVFPLMGALFYGFRNRFIWWLARCCIRIMWWVSQRWTRTILGSSVLTRLFPYWQKDSWMG